MNKEFKWDDSLIKEFLSENFFSYALNQTLEERLNKFKESKQPKPEWEILKYRNKATGIIRTHNEIYSIGNENEIYAVKRLSDGEVFTIGDNVKYTAGMCNYDSYTIDNFFIRGDGRLLVRSGGAIVEYISDISKAKSIQFTTEDGVCIYKGDDYYFINTEWEIRYTGDNYMWIGDNLKAFSSEKAAQEYILMNKPLFSIQEIHDLLSIDLDSYNNLREKAKEKLNKP